MSRGAIGWIAGLAVVALLASGCSGGAGESDLSREASESATSPSPPTTTTSASQAHDGSNTTAADDDPSAEASARWLDVARPNFVLEFDLACGDECDIPPGRHGVIHRSGKAVGAWLVNDQGFRSPHLNQYIEQLPTVDDLFVFTGDESDVSYDLITGLPRQVTDGDTVYSDIAIRFDVDDAVTDLDAARDRWRDANLDSYALEYQLGCFCGHFGAYTIQVNDGVPHVVSYPGQEDGSPVSEEAPLTVDGFFSLIERTLTETPPDLFTISYDDIGAPTTIGLDFWAGAEDDEVGYTLITVIEI
ncbi:MAG: hypothetical protein GY926_22345 [bacterium]|nr:hypothetical protein [bacterium]